MASIGPKGTCTPNPTGAAAAGNSPPDAYPAGRPVAKAAPLFPRKTG